MAGTLAPKLALARAVARSRGCAAAARRARPARCCCAWTATRSPRSARGCAAAACSSRRPTARRPPRRSPRASSSRPGSRSCTTRRARTWPAASPRRCSTAARPHGADRRRARPVRGRRAVARHGRRPAAARARSCSATCSATSSTATASSRRSPTAGPADAAGATQLVLNADDPLIADLGRERAGDALLRRRGRLARAGRDGARGRRQALPPLRRAVRLRRDLPRPPRPLPLPELRPAAPAPAGARPATSCSRASARRASRCTPLPARPRSRSRCRASTTSTTRSPPRRSARALEIPLAEHRSPGCADTGGVRARRDGRAEPAPTAPGRTRAASPRELRILLVKNPAGANEVLRTLALEPGEHDLLGVLNDKIADGRDVSWIWDADFELLAGRIRRVTCSGSRARRAGRAPEVRRHRPRADRDRARPAARALTRAAAERRRRARRRSMRCRPTRRCSRCASCSSRAGRRAARGRDAGRRPRLPTVVWHDLECGAYRADLPLWLELAAQRRRADPRRRRRHRARHARARPRRPHGDRARQRPALLAALSERAGGPGRRDGLRRRARRSSSRARTTRCASCRCRPIQLLGGAGGRIALPAPGARAPAPGRPAWRARSLGELEPFDCTQGGVGPAAGARDARRVAVPQSRAARGRDRRARRDRT